MGTLLSVICWMNAVVCVLLGVKSLAEREPWIAAALFNAAFVSAAAGWGLGVLGKIYAAVVPLEERTAGTVSRVKTRCKNCRKTLDLPARRAGEWIDCKQCGKRAIVEVFDPSREQTDRLLFCSECGLKLPLSADKANVNLVCPFCQKRAQAIRA